MRKRHGPLFRPRDGLDREVCAEKTAARNVFPSRLAAEAVAAEIEDRRVCAYRCSICGKFHIGKDWKRK